MRLLRQRVIAPLQAHPETDFRAIVRFIVGTKKTWDTQVLARLANGDSGAVALATGGFSNMRL